MTGLIGFFSSRWRGEVPLSRLFWRDMLCIGTLVNLLASGVALILMVLKVDLRLAVALHFAPLAYNLFLFMAVLRSAQCSVWISAMAFIWLAVMTVA